MYLLSIIAKFRDTGNLSGTCRARSSQAGFTLVELLVVMVILVMLASLVGPRVIGYLGSSRTKTAKVQIESIVTSLELYRLDVGTYPSSAEGLTVLFEKPANAKTWSGPYLRGKTVPKDPWGFDYHYKFPGEHGEFDIQSLGADNQQGGTDENQDVTGW